MEKTGIRYEVLRQICDIAKQKGLTKVVLFGSRARGDFRRESDIDLAVCGGNADLFREAIDNGTETLLQYDVVNMDREIKKELEESIQKEGIILYEEV